MKFKKRNLIAAAAVVALGAAVLSGCSNKETANTESTNTLTYFVKLPTAISTRVSSLNEVLMYQQREKDTGIHIDFIHPSAGQESEQFNLMIASMELPDIIETTWTLYQGGVQKAIDDGVIIALNDYIDKYAPNFKKTITDKYDISKTYDRGSKTDNGDYFAFSAFNTGNVRTFAGPMVRKDWLDKLGMEAPQTIDDWETMLTAFKEKMGADSPFTALPDYFSTINSFNGAWGVGQRLYVDNGTLKYGPMQDNFKEYISKLHDWYTKGLIDQDFSTNKRAIIDAKLTNGNSGATVFNLGAAMGVYLKQMKDKNPEYDLLCVPFPTLEEGGENNFYVYEEDVGTTSAAITTQCKDPVTAVKWLDFWYSDEGYKLMNFGVEGTTYTMVDGKPKYSDEILNNKEGLSISEALSLQCRAAAPAPGLKQATEYLEQYYEFPQQVAGFKLWAENVDNMRKTILPASIAPTQDETDKLVSLETDLKTYTNEMVIKFITGEEPLTNFDSFRDTLKNTFSVDEYVALKQKMYDRYLDR